MPLNQFSDKFFYHLLILNYMIYMNSKFLAALFLLILSLNFFSLTQAQVSDQDCETCPMVVNAEAQEHFQVTDGNGDKHYVECMGCALKLLKTYETLHIETFCDWYGPDYKIVIDISEKGAITTVNPSSALVLS